MSIRAPARRVKQDAPDPYDPPPPPPRPPGAPPAPASPPAVIPVLVNDRPLLGRRTGIGQYLAQLLAHWPPDARTRPRGLIETFTLGTRPRRPRPAALPGLDALTPLDLRPLGALPPPAGGRPGMTPARRAWELASPLGVRAARALGRGAVLFEPNHIPPARARPTLTTIHDLSVLELPGHHPAHRVAAWRRGLERAVETTDRFVCVSRATADAMRRVLNVDESRLAVVPLASRFERAPADWTPATVRARLGLPDRYWTHVGTIEPRKNVPVLLDALGRLPGAGATLILAGKPGWGSPAFWRSLADHPAAGRVLVAGYVSDAQAAALMVGARAVLCPSIYEGFGLPTLEAMALGTPVAVSTAASLREVVAGAAPTLDPHDAGAWDAFMRAALDDGPERTTAIERGRARAAEFSWAGTARAHDALLASLAGERG